MNKFLLAMMVVAAVPVFAQDAPKTEPEKPAAAQEEAWGKPEDIVGKPAPKLDLALLGGGRLNLDEFKGKKYVVLDFWASWCPWCRKSTDKFVELTKRYAAEDIAFFIVSTTEPEEKVAAYKEKNKVDAVFALDPKREAADPYFVDYIPHIVVIDKDGKVMKVSVGEEKVAVALEETLKELYPNVEVPKPAAVEPQADAAATGTAP